jgi:hypothetical protein
MGNNETDGTAAMPEAGPAARQDHVIPDAEPRSPPARSRRWWFAITLALVGLAVAGWARSHYGAQVPIREALAKDWRNTGVELSARYGGYWDSSVLVLDVTRADAVAPVDMFRVLFQAAEAMHTKNASFEKVQLARSGEPVFVLDGGDFATLGRQFASSENPIFMIRTLPAKLKRPSGGAAFSEWTGGWLGVMKREMEDANTAAKEWVAGGASH